MSKLPGIPKRIDVSSWFCFNVRTGSLIIGWYALLLSIACIFGISALRYLIIWCSDHYEFKSPELLAIMPIFAGTIISSNLLIAFINGAMIAGVMKNKPYFMYPWIYYEYIKFIFGKILNIIFTFIIFIVVLVPDELPFKIRISAFIAFLCMNIIISFITSAIDIYFIVPVVAHCRRLLGTEENKYSPYKESNEGLIEMGN